MNWTQRLLNSLKTYCKEDCYKNKYAVHIEFDMNPYSQNFSLDRDICVFLDLSLEEYQKILIEQFNGVLITYKESIDSIENVWFSNKQDCENAQEWIDSILLMIRINDDEKDNITHVNVNPCGEVFLSKYAMCVLPKN